MGKTSDQLREEIAAKRDDAAGKIDLIEAKVQDLPSLAKDSVKETVDQQLAQARGIVQDKVGQVKQQIDVPTQVSERPLAALGVAFAGGYLIGKALGGDRNGGTGRGYRADWQQAHSQQSGHMGGGHLGASNAMGMGMGIAGGYAAGQQHAASTPSGSGAWSGLTAQERAEWERQAGRPGGGVMDALRNAARSAGLDDTLASLTGALVTTLTDQFHRTLRETFPEFARHLDEQGGLGQGRGVSSTTGMGMGMGSGSMDGPGRMGGADTAYGPDRQQFSRDFGAAAEGARTYGPGQSESQSWKQGYAGGASIGAVPGDSASAGDANRGANI